jgi:hypothetical protein
MSEPITYHAADTITLTEVLKRLKAHIDVVQNGEGKWLCVGTIEYLYAGEDNNFWVTCSATIGHPLPEQALDSYLSQLRNHRLRNRVGERSSWSLVRSSPYVYLDLTRCILEDYKQAGEKS